MYLGKHSNFEIVLNCGESSKGGISASKIKHSTIPNVDYFEIRGRGGHTGLWNMGM